MKMMRTVCSALLLLSVCVSTAAAAPGEAPPSEGPAEVVFSMEAGAYAADSARLELSAPEGYTIYYTTDGSLPTASSAVYTGAIPLQRQGNRWLDETTAGKMLLSNAYKLLSPPELPGANVIRAMDEDLFPGTEHRRGV